MTKHTHFKVLQSCYSGGEGDKFRIVTQDEKNIYFNDENGRWCFWEKSEEGKSFEYYAPQKGENKDIITIFHIGKTVEKEDVFRVVTPEPIKCDGIEVDAGSYTYKGKKRYCVKSRESDSWIDMIYGESK